MDMFSQCNHIVYSLTLLTKKRNETYVQNNWRSLSCVGNPGWWVGRGLFLGMFWKNPKFLPVSFVNTLQELLVISLSVLTNVYNLSRNWIFFISVSPTYFSTLLPSSTHPLVN